MIEYIEDTREPYGVSDQQWVEDFPELMDDILLKIDELNEHLVWLKRKAATIIRKSDILETPLQRWMFQELVKLRLDDATKRAKKNLRRLRLISPMMPKLNSQSLNGNPHIETFKNEITDADIARAKEYPIEYLYVGSLRKMGRSQIGKCPFHQENTASFHIYNDNSFHCYGCAVHGDSIDYIQKLKELSFIESVQFIKGLQ